MQWSKWCRATIHGVLVATVVLAKYVAVTLRIKTGACKTWLLMGKQTLRENIGVGFWSCDIVAYIIIGSKVTLSIKQQLLNKAVTANEELQKGCRQVSIH